MCVSAYVNALIVAADYHGGSVKMSTPESTEMDRLFLPEVWRGIQTAQFWCFTLSLKRLYRMGWNVFCLCLLEDLHSSLCLLLLPVAMDVQRRYVGLFFILCQRHRDLRWYDEFFSLPISCFSFFSPAVWHLAHCIFEALLSVTHSITYIIMDRPSHTSSLL